MQIKQSEWKWQWQKFSDNSKWLFEDWIYPNTMDDFKDKTVLDCGCGGGQHLSFVAPFCAEITGVDLNATDSAKEKTKDMTNVTIKEDDIAEMDLGQQFDIVYSIGVLHHTDNPEASFRNIAKHCKPGGRVIVWVYSHEGNFLNRTFVEWSKVLLLRLPRWVSWVLSHILTTLMYLPIYTIYLLPLHFLPYYEYFQNWRKLSYQRNLLNVFDKLNAPQTWFQKRSDVERWFRDSDFADVHISPYRGVSWRASGSPR